MEMLRGPGKTNESRADDGPAFMSGGAGIYRRVVSLQVVITGLDLLLGQRVASDDHAIDHSTPSEIPVSAVVHFGHGTQDPENDDNCDKLDDSEALLVHRIAHDFFCAVIPL